MSNTHEDLETLRGASEIAKALGPTWTQRKVRYAIEKKTLPGVFLMNGVYCVRKKRLLQGLEQLELGDVRPVAK